MVGWELPLCANQNSAYGPGRLVLLLKKDAGWAQRRVIDLKTLLPIRSLSTSPVVAGYASGINVIFVRTCDVLFMIDLKSSRVKKVCREVTGASSVFPYMSFYYPGTTVLASYAMLVFNPVQLCLFVMKSNQCMTGMSRFHRRTILL